MEKIVVRFIYAVKNILTRQGVDVDRMLAIVETKLLMDKRRPYVQWARRSADPDNNRLTVMLGLLALFGLFISLLIYFFPNFLFSMILYHAYLLFMMAMTLVTDFSTVLLDTTDSNILYFRPVNSKTLFMARFFHILFYILRFTVVLMVFPVIAVFLKFGVLAGAASILTSLLTVLFTVFFTYLLYLLILRVSSEEKVKEIVTFSQIAVTVFFTAGFQIIPRLIDMDAIADRVSVSGFAYIIPPVWMAYTVEALKNGLFDQQHIIMLLLAVGMPVMTIWVLIKYLAPSFASRLAATGRQPTKKEKGDHPFPGNRPGLAERAAGLFCKSPVEKAAFVMTWKITARDKFFRLQLYPGLGYVFVLFFILIFNSGNELARSWEQLADSNKFLFFIYLPVLAVTNGLMFSACHENYEAAWLYFSTPVDKPGRLISGSAIALFVKYFTVIYIPVFIFSLYVWGWPVVNDFIFGLCSNLLFYSILLHLNEHRLPFSQPPNVKKQQGRTVLLVLQLIVIGVLVLIHYLLLLPKKEWLLYVVCIPVLLLYFVLMKQVRRLNWKKISR